MGVFCLYSELTDRFGPGAQSATAHAAAHGPVGAAKGDGVDQHFCDIVVYGECNDSLPARRDGTLAGSNCTAEAAFVR